MATDLQDKQVTPDADANDPYNREFAALTDPEHYNQDATPGEHGDGGRSGFYNPVGDQRSGKAASSDELKAAESDAASSTGAKTDGGLYSGNDTPGRFGSRFKLTKRKGVIGGTIGILLGGGVFFGAGILSGPFQFIHAAQILQQLHFQANDDFGDSRGSKTLLYALAGLGAERSRLGVVGNKAADKWEQKLLRDTGLRPVYSSTTRYAAGFVVDEKDLDKARAAFGGELDANSFGEGVEIKNIDEAGLKRQGIDFSGKDTLPGKGVFIDTRDVSAKQKRTLIRTISKKTGVNKLVSTLASRLLIKRGAVDFHPIKNIARDKKESVADYNQKRLQERAERERVGVVNGGVDPREETDKDGNKTTNPDDVGAADNADDLIKQASEAPGKDAIKGLVKNGMKGAVIIGVFCAVKSFGDNIEDYKYANDVMPMMRMGMDVIATGNQVMSGQGINMDELGAYSQQFYDESAKTTFFSATSIRQGLGEDTKGSVDTPKEASLKDAGSKPEIFNVIDSIPFLGTACSVGKTLSSLPLIGSVVNVIGDVTQQILDAGLSLGGTSSDELMQKALSIAAGQSVDLYAKGGEYGALADTGAFLASNDNMISMGGVPMSTTQTAEVNNYERDATRQDEQSQSFAARYFNLYDHSSMVGSIVDKVPLSFSQFASIFSNPLSNLGTSVGTMFGTLTPKASAADTTPYDYGVPQFGFTLAEQNDPRFENPYDNAAIVEPKLDELNLKYSACFGMMAVADESGVHLTSASAGDQSLNVFKIQNKPECHDGSEDLLRYRFYLADAVSVSSLSCFELNDEQSCANIGFGSTSSTTSTGGPSTSVKSADAPSYCKDGSAQGNQKIVCSAWLFDEYGYDSPGQRGGAGFLKGFLTDVKTCVTGNYGAGCKYPKGKLLVDCSGLVDAAVYDALGVDLQGAATGGYPGNSHLKEISASEAQAGDIVWWGDHTEIVVSHDSNGFSTFGAHMQYPDVSQDISPSHYTSAEKVFRVVP